MKNKIHTPGYVIKRLKDNGFIVWKIFNNYLDSDSRYWTILVNPGMESVYITCHQNKDMLGDIVFEFNDGGKYFKNRFYLSTNSIEVIVDKLIKAGVTNNASANPFYKNH